MTGNRPEPETDREVPADLADGLPPVDFPEELWQSVRAQILDRPGTWDELARDGHWLADWLWPEWAASLKAREVSVDFLAEVVAGYRRELWLWLMGERTWTEILNSLRGRTLRRLLASPGQW